jgi:hypothetical protein
MNTDNIILVDGKEGLQSLISEFHKRFGRRWVSETKEQWSSTQKLWRPAFTLYNTGRSILFYQGGSPLVDSTWFENGLWVRLHPSLLMHGTVGYNVQLVQQVKALAIVRVRISDEDWVHSITPHMMLHVVILNQGTVGFAYDGRRLENLENCLDHTRDC